MAREFDGINQYLNVESAPISGYPLTMAAWFNLDPLVTKTILAIGDTNSGVQEFFMYSDTSNKVRATAQNDSSFQTITTTASFVTGEWSHACAVYTSSTDREVFVNGGGRAAGSSNITPNFGGTERTRIGNRTQTSSFYDGMIAEVSVWNVALTDEEIATLSTGIRSCKVRPQNLVMYVPLIRDDDEDIVGGLSFTAVNSPTIVSHAPVLYPKK